MSNSSIWAIDRILSGATTPGQNRPGGDANGVLLIPQSCSITGVSPSDCLMSDAGHSLRVLLQCRDEVGVFYSPSQTDQNKIEKQCRIQA